MDWDCDNAILTGDDLKNVFAFEPKATTVVRLLSSDEAPVVWSLEGKEEWDNWFQNELPRLDDTASGLVIILARRAGEQILPRMQKVSSDQWLKHLDKEMMRPASPAAKDSSVSSDSGNRDLRRLPFSRELFLDVARRFYMHKSIVRSVNRADVSSFTHNELQMDIGRKSRYPAYVYNCRTANTWNMDLALAATHFPHCNLTFATLFGCPLSIEQTFIQRLDTATGEAKHPLLLSGMFVEFERSRHLRIIEKSIGDIEFRILALDSNPEEMEAVPLAMREVKNREKRSQWLDTTYLRNMLVSWNTQLKKMESHANELDQNPSQQRGSKMFRKHARMTSGAEGEEDDEEDDQEEFDAKRTKRVTIKIRNRLGDIINEYDDKIRDCTMRVDGMAMATQWAQGETNVDIALATSRDSRHMRSISLVTMVFLPGTFFASFFSMTFFNWFDDTGRPEVSGYLWIYVVVSAVFTLLTLGSWWYFGICRRRPRRESFDDEKAFFEP